MADEITVRSGYGIRKTSGTTVLIDRQSRPQQFTIDMTNAKGPYPGWQIISTQVTAIDLSAFTTAGVVPGLCNFINLDPTNYIIVGIRDEETSRFYPFMKIGPTEAWTVYLASEMLEEYGTGPGTGTVEADVHRLAARANAAACDMVVEAYGV